MDERITGSFPGGPSRSTGKGAPRRAPRLRTVAEIEEGIARRTRRGALQRRTRRLILGGLLVVVASFALGAALGFTTHRSRLELIEGQAPRDLLDVIISKEVNRTLLELWKMEDVEALRGRVPGR